MAGRFTSLFSKSEKKPEQTIEVIEQTTSPEVIDIQQTITETAKKSASFLNGVMDIVKEELSIPPVTNIASIPIQQDTNGKFECEIPVKLIISFEIFRVT